MVHAVVQIKKKAESDPKKIIKKTFESHRSLKQVTVVDEDIDPNNAESVEYAMATRFQADKDLVILKKFVVLVLILLVIKRNYKLQKWELMQLARFQKDPKDLN